MRPQIIILIILIVAGVYLNRAYAYFYDSRGNVFLTPQTAAGYAIKGRLPETITYVVLGDSLSVGVGSEVFGNSFPELYTRKIIETGKGVYVVNLASPGAETKDIIANQLNKAIEKKPEMITLLIGINDLHNLVSLEDFANNYQYILQELTTKTSAKIIVLNIPLLGEKSVLLFPYNHILDIRTQQFNHVINQLASQYDTNLIDLYSQTKNEFKNDSGFYSSDKFHPSDEGYMLWADLINNHFVGSEESHFLE